MNNQPESNPISIAPFTWDTWEHWRSIWVLRGYQLSEEGIIGEPDIIPPPGLDVPRDEYEWDFHRIEEVYLSGAGGFWIAYRGDDPVGYVGAQDLGGTIELRNMYVRAEYRRRGIGARLVQALIDHCKSHAVKAVELWTDPEGLGRILYTKLGFRVVDKPWMELNELFYRMNRTTEGETRMRLDLT